MKIIKNNTKKQIEINEIYKKAQEKGVYNIEQAYKKPSYAKYTAWHSIINYCYEYLYIVNYYITFANCQRFGMICKYIGDDGKKHLRYWSSYDVYDCEVIE